MTDDYWKEDSRINSYSLDSVEVTITEDIGLDFDSYQVWVGLYEFPFENLLGEGSAGHFTRGDLPIDLSVPVEIYEGLITANQRVVYHLYVTKGDEDTSEISSSNFEKRFETDPFVRKSGSREIERKQPENNLGDASPEGFSRKNVEGAYAISVDGRTAGQNWTAYLYIYKSAYIRGGLGEAEVGLIQNT